MNQYIPDFLANTQSSSICRVFKDGLMLIQDDHLSQKVLFFFCVAHASFFHSVSNRIAVGRTGSSSEHVTQHVLVLPSYQAKKEWMNEMLPILAGLGRMIVSFESSHEFVLAPTHLFLFVWVDFCGFAC